MTTLATRPANIFAADYAALQKEASRDGAAWLAPLRQRAWERFSELGLPTARRGNERWKYTNLQPLAKVAFKLAPRPERWPALSEVKARAPWDDAWTTLVFVDGHYSPTLSRTAGQGITVSSLALAASNDRASVEKHLTRIATVDEDHFTLLNTAFMSDGAFVHLPDNAAPAQPIHLLFLSTATDLPTASHPRSLLVAGRNSKATVIESYVSLGDGGPYLSDPVLEVSVGDGADLMHYRVLMENENSFHTGNTRVYQHKDSKFSSLSFATGPAVGRNDVHVLLDAEGVECNLTGLYMTTNRQHMDNNISVTHAKPHGTSHQYFKGILAGQSHAVFSGIVVVKPGAMKTYADQKDMNLLLSRGAEVDTKPSLEILADDVKCFHGATAGHVDLDTLYYMRSRGITLETATQMLVRGFASEIVEKVQPPALLRYIEGVTERLLPGLKFEAPR
jgi:Fe-S cluster assembly protein SufD